MCYSKYFLVRENCILFWTKHGFVSLDVEFSSCSFRFEDSLIFDSQKDCEKRPWTRCVILVKHDPWCGFLSIKNGLQKENVAFGKPSIDVLKNDTSKKSSFTMEREREIRIHIWLCSKLCSSHTWSWYETSTSPFYTVERGRESSVRNQARYE